MTGLIASKLGSHRFCGGIVGKFGFSGSVVVEHASSNTTNPVVVELASSNSTNPVVLELASSNTTNPVVVELASSNSTNPVGAELARDEGLTDTASPRPATMLRIRPCRDDASQCLMFPAPPPSLN
ncbi:hypothetical protein H7698_12455 [Pseudomonas sp. p50]|uniref:hypothetical protein n=1 Tax=Pseudomonas sp. p50(2008) TaxID=2816832 RepID=UPI00188D2729|nr:hypothetical protein [Pseudomonas sp. p50(2008)]MBF4556890.1 hypothetical protein [Pseudomonas sp. p50(2008)]